MARPHSVAESLSGQHLSDPWFISIAHDPNNLIFDPVDPGESISYCALHDGSDWTVAEPITNRDQFDDCESWMWLNVCIRTGMVSGFIYRLRRFPILRVGRAAAFVRHLNDRTSA